MPPVPTRRLRLAGLVPALIAGALAAPAAAQEPPDEPVERRTYRGETSQDRPVAVRTDTDGLVERVRISWAATACRRGRYYRTTTVDTRPFDRVTPTRLRDEYDYVERSAGGIRATVTATLVARLEGSGARERWTGTFRTRVVVRRDGRRVDTCRTRRAVRWTARLVRE